MESTVAVTNGVLASSTCTADPGAPVPFTISVVFPPPSCTSTPATVNCSPMSAAAAVTKAGVAPTDGAGSSPNSGRLVGVALAPGVTSGVGSVTVDSAGAAGVAGCSPGVAMAICSGPSSIAGT